MKQILLLVLAFTLSMNLVKAEEDAVTFTQIGGVQMPSDSVQLFMHRDTIIIKATWTNAATATAATAHLTSCTNWASDWTGVNLTLDPAAGMVDTFIVVPGNFPLNNIPEGKNNVHFVQVKVQYPGGLKQPNKVVKVTNDVTDNRVVISQLGSFALPQADSVKIIDKKTALVVKGNYSNWDKVESIGITLLSNTDWKFTDTKSVAVSLTAPFNGLIDTSITIPDDFPIWKEDKHNVQYVQVKVTYEGGVIVQPYDLVRISGEDIVIEGIEDYLTELTITVNDDADRVYDAGGWVPIGDSYTGDVYHLKGKYEVEKSGHKATSVTIGINTHHKTTWALEYNVGEVVASVAKGNLDGIIDHKIRLPHFYDSDYLVTDDATVSNQLIQVRVTYDDDAAQPFAGGVYRNFITDYYAAEETPSTCMDVSGITLTNITDSTVTVDWNLGNDAAWDILIAKAGTIRNPDASEDYQTVYVEPYVFSGLTPGVDYEFYMRTVCDNDTLNYKVGGYSDKMTFKTTGTIPASVNSLGNKEMFKAYPNPVNDVLKISADQAYYVDIVDISGRTVMSSVMGGNNESINVAELNKGLYVIYLSNDRKVMSKTFIKK